MEAFVQSSLFSCTQHGELTTHREHRSAGQPLFGYDGTMHWSPTRLSEQNPFYLDFESRRGFMRSFVRGS
ncbi:hypothetical protein CgunFtcFv8_012319 [Champsocephalus gunnari]|uniref:Uncharacterized protein n=1 Tax=Champsocephalus gunnari TaxID=52237 RepID=A0AAN8D8E1_CHAGU|nr:hypothetical protein CgunFtcFv8_012319 [Champsocephalus gunnari]